MNLDLYLLGLVFVFLVNGAQNEGCVCGQLGDVRSINTKRLFLAHRAIYRPTTSSGIVIKSCLMSETFHSWPLLSLIGTRPIVTESIVNFHLLRFSF